MSRARCCAFLMAAALALLVGAPGARAQGVVWTPRSVVQRYGHAMAYDSARGVSVLFGGWGDYRVVGDTWGWNGSAWALRSGAGPATLTPPARSGQAMAYDSRRHVVVLFGGSNAYPSFLGDTWEWDGAVWTQRTAGGTAGPAGRANHAMAYDAQRGVVVLFGGQGLGSGGAGAILSDTWEWDGAAWTQRSMSGPHPTARAQHAMVFDSRRGVSVLFGGASAGGYLADTWEWDGTGWTQRTPAVAPGGRYGHAMAFDAQKGVTLLFGGGRGFHVADYADTWEWNGSAWTQRGGAGPAGRDSHAMAFDSARAVTVLFGGEDGASTALSDTWEWNGNGWAQRPTADPAVDPAPRYAHAAAYDGQRGATVVFGGYTGSAYLGDTWAWDGAAWSQRSGTGPSARRASAMCFDRRRGVTVLFGGANATTTFGDTWEWNGTAWAPRATAGPPARSKHAMAYDTQRGVSVLFGGYDGNGSTLGDTWEWNGAAWTERQIPGPPGRYYTAMAYDSGRGVCVIYGGRSGAALYMGDTWEWDGIAWADRTSAGPDARYGSMLVYDEGQARTLLFGGWSGTSSVSGRYLIDPWVWDGSSWSYRLTNTPAGRYLGGLVYDEGRGAVVLFGGVTGPIEPPNPTFPSFVFGDTVEARLSACPTVPEVTLQPAARTVCPGGPASFSIVGGGAGLTVYDWQLEFVPGQWVGLAGGAPNCAYADAQYLPSVTITIPYCGVRPTGPQAVRVRCMVADVGGCGIVFSSPAVCTVCPADFDCSGGLSVQDIFAFLQAWFAGSASANFNGLNGVTVQDIFDFLAAWFAGC